MLLSKKEKDDLQKMILEAVDASFSGWDFSWTHQFGGKPEFAAPWNYRETVESHLPAAKSLLDLGTGGGEFLASLQPLPETVKATEAWPPNIDTASIRLNPLGIEVHGVEDGIQERAPLPFSDSSFDLVIDRHESYESAEVFRVLKPGGIFITQQVGCRDIEKLLTMFGSLTDGPDDFDWNLASAAGFLKEAGFTVTEQNEHIANTRFYDIRVVVYFLKVLAWSFPDFDIDLYRKRLANIYALIKRDGYFEDIDHRFFLVAEKPY